MKSIITAQKMLDLSAMMFSDSVRSNLASNFIVMAGLNKKLYALSFNFDSPEEKSAIINIARMVYKTESCISWCVVSEAWMSRDRGKMPSESDDRQEVLMMIARSEGDETLGKISNKETGELLQSISQGEVQFYDNFAIHNATPNNVSPAAMKKAIEENHIFILDLNEVLNDLESRQNTSSPGPGFH